jgi:DNA modification methylase/superfamily II DNA or RNA helicase
MNKNYSNFLESKQAVTPDCGISIHSEAISTRLFDFQKDITAWALRKGRVAIFADCGMGKTPMQLEWALHVPGRVLILAPLAVAQQTEREGQKFSIPVSYQRSEPLRGNKIIVTNYEMLEHFDIDKYTGIVLDESSILKSFDGVFRNKLISAFEQTPYRLCCTATPSPNDFMELGNHSEFLGVLTRTEMLSTFFVHDGGDTSKWRLKRHAEKDFWKWICSWAVMLRKPSDLGYEDRDFVLPKINFHDMTVDQVQHDGSHLFAMPAETLDERRKARSASIEERIEMLASIVSVRPDESWLIWCNLNSESDAAVATIPGAMDIRGAHTREEKESRLLSFISGETKILVSKPSICGFGLNLQHCRNVAFLGLSDSYEQFYQAVRRCWRFGQKQEVDCFIVTASTEGAVTENIKRKERDAAKMVDEMVNNMHELNQSNVREQHLKQSKAIHCISEHEDGWTMHLGDAVDVVGRMADNSMDFSIFSPPFASLYTYSALPNDMGNCTTHAEFFEHFKFLTEELFRVMKPGRCLSFHCMNLPRSKERDGIIGIWDFRGDLIRIFQESGFVYHSEVCIWKDPVTAMQRTKAIGLLHKQLKKDSCMSRQGIADYLVTMRKPGENPDRVKHTNDSFPVSRWQQWASPIWMDIDPSDTLQRESAREHEDERHICPLQLEVIRRALVMWSNEGDTVLSPFAGIGSEGYISLQHGRKFIGVELKESYYRQAVLNLKAAKREAVTLFDQE